MGTIKKITALAAGCISMFASYAQLTKINNDPDEQFKLAKEYYLKEQYSLALPVFKNIYNNGLPGSNMPVNVQVEARYYTIACGLKLDEAWAEKEAVDFIALEHNAPRVQMLSYELGEYYYRKKDYDKANTYYAQSKIANLSNTEIAAMKFHQAYGYFTTQQFDKAKPLFDVIRQLPQDENYIDANYYYGFITFYEKNYKQALESFKVVESNPAYENIVPFYIAEIYYFNGDRDKAINYAQDALKKGNQFYALQLKQLIGHTLFEKRKYADALPYLQEYVANTPKVRREDLYELSYCYYEASNWQKAIQGFKQLGGKEDSLAQNSMYLLADAYLKVNDKPNARNAFLFCASNNSNASQKEISTFSYAKLSYELGYLDIALKELRTFINAYPGSSFIQEARELEVNVLANTSNYKEALVLFDNLSQQSENAKKIYPKILYGRAVELINDQQINAADVLFTRLTEIPYNNQYLQLAYFWKGEIAYRSGKVDEAYQYFTKYISDGKTNGEVNLINARYNLGYCEMRRENYKSALGYFEQVSKNISASSTNIQQDAYIRSADCYFMNKDYRQALKMYEEVIALGLPQADYALYQKAIIAGATNKPNEKVAYLESLSQRYPGSTLHADANMEIANTYIADENYSGALPYLEKVLKDRKASALHPQAYLKAGIAYFNLDKNDESLGYFKKLVTAYPNSQESDDAIEYIRNIFIEQQKPGDFATFMRDNGKAITHVEEDSLTYRAAMLRYDARDFVAAKNGFASYIGKFPDGRYAVEANYFSAEIYISNKDFNGALPFYTAVAAKAPNKYAERSVLQSARIYYFDVKDYVNAEKYFQLLKSLATQQENKLEAMRGLLRCQFKQQKWNEAVPNAEDLLKEKGIASDDRMMASMVIAKSHQSNNRVPEAITAYKMVIAAGKSEFSAEAQYRIAELLTIQGKYSDAEKAAFEVIKKFGSYDYWVTKSYIQLGDIYFAQKDYFNSEATYKSVVDNATIEELKNEATQKLAKVTEEKNKTNQVEPQ